MILAVAAMAIALVIALAWRSPWAPALGALVGVCVAIASRVAQAIDIEHALRDLWRPMISILAIMMTTSCAAELGIFDRLASAIEPYTRGPVRRAFKVVFVISALTAAILSNDAAILLITPAVIALLRTVYPKRNPKFVVPFAFAVFVAAGVAPLATGNPMNLVVAYRAQISFNTYALHMIPIAIVGWFVAYAMLAWVYRDVLSDEAPALGAAPPVVPLSGHAEVVLAITAASIASYPILAALGQPIWPIAAAAATICCATALHRRVPPRAIAAGISWEIVPFLFGVLVLATSLARAGVTMKLAELYAATPLPLASVGTIGALGSALVGNHPMALLHSLALAGQPNRLVFAALVGGDLGPRLLPIGSLAGLLWAHALRRQHVIVSLRTFVRVGALVTIPSFIASLVVLWLEG